MMNEPGLHAAMADFLAHPSYHPCLLLVHPDIRRLMDASDELASAYGWPRLRVGRELSAALLAVPPADRPRAAQRWMEEQASQMAPGPVLCTEIDLLFEPTLQLDPLRLLLDNTVRRCNDIVHRADRCQEDTSGEAQAITFSWTQHAVDTINHICLVLDELVADAVGHLQAMLLT